MDHIIDSPDWSTFKAHHEKYLSLDNPRYAGIISALSQFACMNHENRHDHHHKMFFPSVDHVPSCIKYVPPTNISYVNAEPIFGDKVMAAVTVDLSALINIDHDHFLNLHPGRYDKVKEALSLGEIDMPIVTICEEGFPRVGNGRHRAVALYKYGYSAITILVPDDEKNEILQQLSQGIWRPPSMKEFVVDDKRFGLKDFKFNVNTQ